MGELYLQVVQYFVSLTDSRAPDSTQSIAEISDQRLEEEINQKLVSFEEMGQMKQRSSSENLTFLQTVSTTRTLAAGVCSSQEV